MADGGRFSASFAAVQPSSLPARVQAALDELSKALGGVVLAPVRWNDNFVAAAFDVSVDLPSRGPVNGLDIRHTEPIIFTFHLHNYPQTAPSAYADRKDFPASRLPHLNPTRNGQPFSLCLHRGSMNDWFAEHTISDLVQRVRSWLRDAASERLMRDGDHFEHTRLTDVDTIIVFDPARLESRIQSSWSETNGAQGLAYFHAQVSAGGAESTGWNSKLAVHIEYLLAGTPEAEQIELVSTWNALPAALREYQAWAIGILVWSRSTECSTYFGHLPSTYSELVAFAEASGVPLKRAFVEYIASEAKRSVGIPVTLAILRPRPLLGTSSSIELLSFVVVLDGDNWLADGEPKGEAVVLPLSHRRPLTPAFAAGLSERDMTAAAFRRPAILGAGALGSRLALHLAKAGAPDQLLVDYATLSPHHMVRHGLLARYLGKNKAEALRLEIADIYRRGGSVKPLAYEGSAFDVLRDQEALGATTLLVDASASSSVLAALVQTDLKMPICRAEIADSGRLGILSYEGANRNPRLDDLQAHLWGLAVDSEPVAAWLARHREEIEGGRGPALEEIGIGIGCSSATMRLADDVVAHHAAQFSMAIHHAAGRAAADTGLIRLSRLEKDRALESMDIAVPPLRLLRVRNEHEWMIRMSRSVDAIVQDELRRAGRRETGGLLLGYIHRRRRVAYVTGILRESSDSVGTATGFIRGTDGYAEQLEAIKIRTGGLIGYIGEWHTHPDGSPEPSRRDRQAVDQTKVALAPANMPAIMVIAAARGTKAFLYE